MKRLEHKKIRRVSNYNSFVFLSRLYIIYTKYSFIFNIIKSRNIVANKLIENIEILWYCTKYRRSRHF